MLCDLPYKVLNTITYNLTIYFMTNLRREPGPFFFFLLMSFLVTVCMSMIFRTIASASRTLSQAMVPAALLILALVTFTGFVIPIDYMLGWCRWLNYIDPLAYAFESLMVNEFHGRTFQCTELVPSADVDEYRDLPSANRVCTTVGATQGSPTVNGDAYINSLYQYFHSHKWRNVGIVIGFIIFFLGTYMFFAEIVSAKKSKGEVLVFKRGHKLTSRRGKGSDDTESRPANSGPAAVAEKSGSSSQTEIAMPQSTDVFHWNNLCYEVPIKSETRRILDNVAGWVKPGTMTALMVGSTLTCFNNLANRYLGRLWSRQNHPVGLSRGSH